MPPKRTTGFKDAHISSFGLKVCERDPSTKHVVLVACQFCTYFGCKEKVGAKRKATTNVQYFHKPFCTDVYKQHMQSQHPQHWARYSALTSKEEKSSFFTNNAPVVHWNTICSHFVGSQAHIHYFVNKEIVDIIIGEMLFHPDDTNEGKSIEHIRGRCWTR